MTGLVYLDIAIGVTFLILVFSLFAGAIQEAAAAILNLRAQTLREGIFRLLGKDDFKAFWNAPLIDSLKGPAGRFTRWFDKNSKTDNTSADGTDRELRNPSVIPSDMFSKSVLGQLRMQLKSEIEAKINELQSNAQTVSPRDLTVLASVIREKAEDPAASDLIRRVAIVLEGVEDKAEAIETAIENWYEQARNRFAGWYVRRTQYFLFTTGLILAVLTNTDPIRYGQELRENDALRKKVVVMAEEVAALDDLEDVMEHFGLRSEKNTAKVEQIKAIQSNVSERVQHLSARLDELETKSGWAHCGSDTWGRCLIETINPWNSKYKETLGRNPVPGWILLAFAVMLGSQFWLDTLHRFVSIRSAAAGILGQSPSKASKQNT